MAFRVGQPSFSHGEIGPRLRSRFDVQSYQAALALARNVIVLKEGGLTKRPGTQLVARAYSQVEAKPVRLIPFTYSIEQTYVLEMGQGYMRPAALGGMVLEEEQIILGATNANPIVLHMIHHGMAAGDQMYLIGVSGMVELNRRIVNVLASIDDDHFSIALDGTSFGVFTSATGGVTRVDPPPPTPPPPTVPPVVPPPAKPSFTELLRRFFGGLH